MGLGGEVSRFGVAGRLSGGSGRVGPGRAGSGVLEGAGGMRLTEVTGRVAEVFDAVGSAVLVIGFAWSVVAAVRAWRSDGGRAAYQTLRGTFGGALLLGLEVLVAADLIRTVAVSPTLLNVIVLGIIVLIRTFLSFSLQIEVDGTLPWRRATAGWPPANGSTASGSRPSGSTATGSAGGPQPG